MNSLRNAFFFTSSRPQSEHNPKKARKSFKNSQKNALALILGIFLSFNSIVLSKEITLVPISQPAGPENPNKNLPNNGAAGPTNPNQKNTSSSNANSNLASTMGTEQVWGATPNPPIANDGNTTLIVQDAEGVASNWTNVYELLNMDSTNAGTTTTASVGSAGWGTSFANYITEGIQNFWTSTGKAFFTNIGQFLEQLLKQILAFVIEPIVQMLTSVLVEYAYNPDVSVGTDQFSRNVQDLAGWIRNVSNDLLLLFFVLSIWRYWANASWKGASVMGAVARIIVAASAITAWPTIYHYIILISNALTAYLISQNVINPNAIADGVAGAMSQVIMGSQTFSFADSILSSAGQMTVTNGLTGPIIYLAQLALVAAIGLAIISSIVVFFTMKVIQIVIVVAAFVFAPFFLAMIVSPDTSSTASSFIRSFIETALWTFVWTVFLMLFVFALGTTNGANYQGQITGTASTISTNTQNPWFILFLELGILQAMIQTPGYLSRGKISEAGEFLEIFALWKIGKRMAGGLFGATGLVSKAFRFAKRNNPFGKNEGTMSLGGAGVLPTGGKQLQSLKNANQLGATTAARTGFGGFGGPGGAGAAAPLKRGPGGPGGLGGMPGTSTGSSGSIATAGGRFRGTGPVAASVARSSAGAGTSPGAASSGMPASTTGVISAATAGSAASGSTPTLAAGAVTPTSGTKSPAIAGPGTGASTKGPAIAGSSTGAVTKGPAIAGPGTGAVTKGPAIVGPGTGAVSKGSAASGPKVVVSSTSTPPTTTLGSLPPMTGPVAASIARAASMGASGGGSGAGGSGSGIGESSDYTILEESIAGTPINTVGSPVQSSIILGGGPGVISSSTRRAVAQFSGSLSGGHTDGRAVSRDGSSLVPRTASLAQPGTSLWGAITARKNGPSDYLAQWNLKHIRPGNVNLSENKDNPNENAIDYDKSGKIREVKYRRGASDAEIGMLNTVCALATLPYDDGKGHIDPRASSATNDSVKDAGKWEMPIGRKMSWALTNGKIPDYVQKQETDRLETEKLKARISGAMAYVRGEKGNHYTEYLTWRAGKFDDTAQSLIAYTSTHQDASIGGFNLNLDQAIQRPTRAGLDVNPITMAVASHEAIGTLRPTEQHEAIPAVMQLVNSRLAEMNIRPPSSPHESTHWGTPVHFAAADGIVRTMPATQVKAAMAIGKIAGIDHITPQFVNQVLDKHRTSRLSEQSSAYEKTVQTLLRRSQSFQGLT